VCSCCFAATRGRRKYEDVSGQLLCKRVPAATDTSGKKQELYGPCRDVTSKGQTEFREFCMGGCEETT
jgi:hypothetical protein